jgi:inosine-uridine nucleoside N-ribohydrolase
VAERLQRIVVMGGSARAGGNRGPWAEANIASDPEAAAIVFAADVARTMIGLDVTSRLILDDADVATLAQAGDPVATFASEILPFYIDFYASVHGARHCAVHDALAVAAVADPALVTTRTLPVVIETAGAHTRGMTVVDLRDRPSAPDAAHTDVALDVDVPAARSMLLSALATPTEGL